jgi:uncharacterized protein YuzE
MDDECLEYSPHALKRIDEMPSSSPISITVDPDSAAVYIGFLDETAEFDGSLALLRDSDGVVRDYTFAEVHDWEGCLVDVTPDDRIIGFEILSADDSHATSLVRDYARDNGLVIPEDLRVAAEAFAGDPAA